MYFMRFFVTDTWQFTELEDIDKENADDDKSFKVRAWKKELLLLRNYIWHWEYQKYGGETKVGFNFFMLSSWMCSLEGNFI